MPRELPPVTKAGVTTKTNLVEPFEFLGNKGNAIVKKYNSIYGDGDIHTGDGGKVIVSALANLSQVSSTIIRLTLTYRVWESSYFSKRGRNTDCLLFTATKDINVSRFCTTTVTYKGNDKITTVTSVQLGACAEAFYTDYYNTKDSRHGWYPIDPKSKLDASWYGTAVAPSNRAQSWLPLTSNAGQLLVKIDGSGSELTNVGNIGIKGALYIPLIIKSTDTIVTTVDDQVNSVVTTNKSYGTCPVLSNISDNVYDALGHGYDMCLGSYACGDDCKDPVMDLDALNAYKRINESKNVKSEFISNEGKTFEEYTSDITKKLEIKASASAFGATLNHQTTITSKSETSKTRTCAFKTVRDSLRGKKYQIEGATDFNTMASFLSKNFLNDLNRVSAEKLVEQYGTHVLMGVFMGGRVDYNYMYDRSASKETNSSSISSSTSFSWSAKGIPTQAPKEKGKSYEDELKQKILNSSDAKTIEQFRLALADSQKNGSQKTEAKKDGTGDAPKGTGGSVSVLNEESRNSSSTIETENTRFELTVVGGDTRKAKALQKDPSSEAAFDSWADTLDMKNDPIFSDFVPGTICPLYELIPAGYKLTAEAVKNAIKEYYRKNGTTFADPKHGIMTVPFCEYRGKDDCINYDKANGGKNDGEISTQKGKRTDWQIRVQPVNFEDGSFIFALTLTVYEGGQGAGRSIIQLRKQVPVKRNYIYQAADIPTIKGVNHIADDASGSVVGSCHDYIDITDSIRKQGCQFIDTDSERVFVRIDGSGDDYGNIGVKCKLKVPFIYY